MVGGEGLWDSFGRKPLMTWGPGGRGVELCSRKLTLAAVSVDLRGQDKGGEAAGGRSRDGETASRGGEEGRVE